MLMTTAGRCYLYISKKKCRIFAIRRLIKYSIMESSTEKGYVSMAVSDESDIKNIREEILRLKEEKNAVILAHYYQKGEIQDIADYIGDSLALAQIASKLTQPVIVLCGVNFMGETAKILCPDKTVLIPDMDAGCSLADSCDAEEFKKFIDDNPDHTVISYVNTSAGVKALTDVLVTSSNARQIVESFPEDTPIIFGPDRNLGNYINSVTGRNMKLWNGACHVHEQFSIEKIAGLKRQYPSAKVLAHPECKKKKRCPDKTFIPAPPNDSTCACNDCSYMKLNTMQKLYDCLKNESPKVEVDSEIAEKARRPIERMLEISEKLGI